MTVGDASSTQSLPCSRSCFSPVSYDRLAQHEERVEHGLGSSPASAQAVDFSGTRRRGPRATWRGAAGPSGKAARRPPGPCGSKVGVEQIGLSAEQPPEALWWTIIVVGLGVLVASRPDLLVTLLPGRGGAAGLLVTVVALAAALLWAARAPRAARIRGTLRSAIADARSGALSRSTWPGLLALSVVALAGYLALFVVAAWAAGTQASVLELLPLLVLGLLAMALPLNIGGWGPREGATAVAFGAVGLGAAQGLTTAVVYGVLSLIACLPGAVVLLLPAVLARYRQVRYRHHLPAARPAMSVQLERSPA
jgi:Lysylphosphatidylglycerol synthase TM region